ncbi:unnamed protein product [Auanema sp. JU1783]|nr:unnamed protein product [Auanema sp. JU1783]
MVVCATPQMAFSFDDVRTKTVENLIFHLIEEVTNITETYPLPKGQSPESLIIAVENSVDKFVQQADVAIKDCLHAKGSAAERLIQAIGDVQRSGQNLSKIGREFVRDSTSSQRRKDAVEAGQLLLQSVAHLLIIADMLDVSLLTDVIEDVLDTLERLRNSESNQEVIERYSTLMAQIEEVEETIKRRINDLRDPADRDDLLAAFSTLKAVCPMVLNSTKAFVRHPESEESRRNCDYAYEQASNALHAMSDILNGKRPRYFSRIGDVKNLAIMLDDFEGNVYAIDQASYKKHLHNPKLESMLEDIIRGAGILANYEFTRPNRRSAIPDECNNVRQALQDLLNEFEKNLGRKETSDDVDLAMVQVKNKTKDLRRQLRRAIVDHVSDGFLDLHSPLLNLIAAAESRDPERTEICAKHFLQHADELVKVAKRSCEMSTDLEGIRVIRYTADSLEKLAPEVANAAHLLCAQGDSEVAKKNMQVYREAWLSKVRLLTMAVDSIISLDDFLAVSEAHIGEDAMRGIEAIHVSDSTLLDGCAGAIRGRALRVCSVVENELDALPVNSYSDRIKIATVKLRGEKLNEFADRAGDVIQSVQEAQHKGERDPTQRNRDSDEFVEVCTLVHDAVKEIRNALLINRSPDEVDSDNEYEEDGHTLHDNASKISEGENQQKIMRRLPEEDKKKIQEQIDVFKITQTKFEREVAKWDETGNDIIVLAKHMCNIMMNMTDFTRGRGPLKTTMDVIGAAQEISVAGEKLKTLATQIADESADSYTKQDLMAYLSKIPLYCQQLNICSKVKADVQQVGNELVVSGLDSAMSLIQTARNLLGAVVMTVKSAYIASTKCALKERRRMEAAHSLYLSHKLAEDVPSS